MTTIKSSVRVNRHIEEIWDYISQVEKIPEWAAGAYDVSKESPDPIGLGSRFTTFYDLDGEKVQSLHRVIEFERPNRWLMKIHYVTVGITSWTFQEDGDGTVVAASVEHWFDERTQPALDKELLFLKQVLETGVIPPESLRGKD